MPVNIQNHYQENTWWLRWQKQAGQSYAGHNITKIKNPPAELMIGLRTIPFESKDQVKQYIRAYGPTHEGGNVMGIEWERQSIGNLTNPPGEEAEGMGTRTILVATGVGVALVVAIAVVMS